MPSAIEFAAMYDITTNPKLLRRNGLEQFNKNCSLFLGTFFLGTVASFFHANHFSRSPRTNPGCLRQRRRHTRSHCAPFPRLAGPGLKAAPATSSHRRHRAATASLRPQTNDCGHPPRLLPGLAGQKERLDAQGTAGGQRAKVFPRSEEHTSELQ